MKSLHVDPYGFYKNLKPQERIAVVCGNGPSLRGFDFARELDGFDVFGMNAAYRHWDRIGWYPTYYSCLDYVVGMSHLHEIARLIERRDEYGIRAFFLTANVVRALGALSKLTCVINFDVWRLRHWKLFFFYRPVQICGSTGSGTLLWAAYLGYKSIMLLGIDGYSVEILPESSLGEYAVLTVSETPKHNPNYFIDDYQQKGDKYNIPNPDKPKGYVQHTECWDAIRMPLRLLDVEVVNANPQSGICAFPKCSFAEAVGRLAGRRASLDEMRNAPGLAGLHSREENLQLNEVEVFYPFLPEHNGIMLDVGAHVGASCLYFLSRGYAVHAFEPDAQNRAALAKLTHGYDKLIIDSRAVADVSDEQRFWYATPDSSGASGLLPFTENHAQTASVTTVTLRDYCSERNITHVDFLKIDAEGYDLMALTGFPFESIRPACILCEFEDRKTLPLGYSLHDLANFLLERGYHVFMSEWWTILRYGIQHQWRRIVPWPSECLPFAWGNLLAFEQKPDTAKLERVVDDLISTTKNHKRISTAMAHALRSKLTVKQNIK